MPPKSSRPQTASSSTPHSLPSTSTMVTKTPSTSTLRPSFNANEITIQPFYILVDSSFLTSSLINLSSFITEITSIFNNDAICLNKTDLETSKNVKKSTKDIKKKDDDKKEDTVSNEFSLKPTQEDYIFITLAERVATEVAKRKSTRVVELEQQYAENEGTSIVSPTGKCFPLYIFLFDIIENVGDAMKIGIDVVFYYLPANVIKTPSSQPINASKSKSELNFDTKWQSSENIDAIHCIHAFDQRISEFQSSTQYPTPKDEILSRMDNTFLRTLYSLRFRDSPLHNLTSPDINITDLRKLSEIVYFPFTYERLLPTSEKDQQKPASYSTTLVPGQKEKIDKKSPKKGAAVDKALDKPIEKNETLSILVSEFKANLLNFYSYSNDYLHWKKANVISNIPYCTHSETSSLFNSYANMLEKFPVNVITLPLICATLCDAAAGESDTSILNTEEHKCEIDSTFVLPAFQSRKYPAKFPIVAADDIETIRFCANINASTSYNEHLHRKPLEMCQEVLLPFTSKRLSTSQPNKKFNLSFRNGMMSKSSGYFPNTKRIENSITKTLKNLQFRRVYYEEIFKNLFLSFFLSQTCSSQLFSTFSSQNQLNAGEFYSMLLDVYSPYNSTSLGQHANLQLFISTMQHKIRAKLAQSRSQSQTQKFTGGFYADWCQNNPHFELFTPNFPENIFETFNFFSDNQWNFREELDRDSLYRRLNSIASASPYKNMKVACHLCRETNEHLFLCWEALPLDTEAKRTYSEYFSPNFSLPQFIEQFPLFSSLPASSSASLAFTNHRHVYDWDVESFNGKTANRHQLFYPNDSHKIGLLTQQISTNLIALGLFSSNECEINVTLRNDDEIEEIQSKQETSSFTSNHSEIKPESQLDIPEVAVATPASGGKPSSAKKPPTGSQPKPKGKADHVAAAAQLEKEKAEELIALKAANDKQATASMTTTRIVHKQNRFVANFTFNDSTRIVFQGDDNDLRSNKETSPRTDDSRSYFNYTSKYGLHFEVTEAHEILIWNATVSERLRKIDVHGNVYRWTASGKEEKLAPNGDMYYRSKDEKDWNYVNKLGNHSLRAKEGNNSETADSSIDMTITNSDISLTHDGIAIGERNGNFPILHEMDLPAVHQVDLVSGAQIYLHSQSLVYIQYANGNTAAIFEDGTRIFVDKDSCNVSGTITIEHPHCPVIVINESEIHIDVREGSNIRVFPSSHRVYFDHPSRASIFYNRFDHSILFLPSDTRQKLLRYESFVQSFTGAPKTSLFERKEVPRCVLKVNLFSKGVEQLFYENDALEVFKIDLKRCDATSILSRQRRNRPTSATSEELPPSTPRLDKNFDLVYKPQLFPLRLPHLIVARADGTGYELHTQKQLQPYLQTVKSNSNTVINESTDGEMVNIHILTALPSSSNGYKRTLSLPDLLRSFPPHLLYPIHKYKESTPNLVLRQNFVSMPPITIEARNASIEQWKAVENERLNQQQILEEPLEISSPAGLKSATLDSVDINEANEIQSMKVEVIKVPFATSGAIEKDIDAGVKDRQFGSFFTQKSVHSSSYSPSLPPSYRQLSKLGALLGSVRSNIRSSTSKLYPNIIELTDNDIEEFFVHPVSEFDALQKQYFVTYLDEMYRVLDHAQPLIKRCQDMLAYPYDLRLRTIAFDDPVCLTPLSLVGEFMHALLYMLGFESEQEKFELIVEDEVLFNNLHELQYQVVASLNKINQKRNEFELIPNQKNEKMSKIEEEKTEAPEGNEISLLESHEGQENDMDNSCIGFNASATETSSFTVEFSATGEIELPYENTAATAETNQKVHPFQKINPMPKPLRLATHLSHGRSFKHDLSSNSKSSALPSILTEQPSCDFNVVPSAIDFGQIMIGNTYRVSINITNTDTTVKRIQISQPQPIPEASSTHTFRHSPSSSMSSGLVRPTSPASSLTVARTFYRPGLLAPGMQKRCEVELYAGSIGEFTQTFTIRSERNILKIPIRVVVCDKVLEMTNNNTKTRGEIFTAIDEHPFREEKTNRNDIVLPPIHSRPSSQSAIQRSATGGSTPFGSLPQHNNDRL